MRRHSIPLSPALFTRSAEWPLEGLVSPQFLSPVFLLTGHRPPTCPDPVGVAAHSCFKSFSCNTCSPPRKCCKQKTYGTVKPLDATLTENRGWGSPAFRRFDVQTFRRADEGPIYPLYFLQLTALPTQRTLLNPFGINPL